MLQQVVLQTAVPMTLNIDQADPDEILVVKSISGLSPADLTLYIGDFARDGGYYQGRRAGKRNPVLNLKLNPNYADDIEVSDIREMLYSTFYQPLPNSDGVQILFVDDRKPDRYLIGYTEKLDTDLWSKDQSAQISLICTDPYFKSAVQNTGSDAVGWTSLPLTYDGSARTGLEATIKVKTATGQVVLDLNGVTMTLVRSFAVNDTIVINTTPGSRKITLNGVDIMGSLTSTSKWLLFGQLNNTIKVYGTAVGDGKAVLSAYNYRASWWGI